MSHKMGDKGHFIKMERFCICAVCDGIRDTEKVTGLDGTRRWDFEEECTRRVSHRRCHSSICPTHPTAYGRCFYVPPLGEGWLLDSTAGEREDQREEALRELRQNEQLCPRALLFLLSHLSNGRIMAELTEGFAGKGRQWKSWRERGERKHVTDGDG